MKFIAVISALALATSVAAFPAAHGETADALFQRAPVPGCIKARGEDEDAWNICCLKAKREAEAASAEARELAATLSVAREVRAKVASGAMSSVQAREAFPLPGCIKARGEDEDAWNICCLKAKRDAEAAADAAADAYKSYSEIMKFRD